MKMLMIIVDSGCREELEVLFQKVGVTGYTEVPGVHGVGQTGIRMGSNAFPKTSSLFLTMIESDRVEDLREAMAGYCEAYDRHMKMVQWGIEEIV